MAKKTIKKAPAKKVLAKVKNTSTKKPDAVKAFQTKLNGLSSKNAVLTKRVERFENDARECKQVLESTKKQLIRSEDEVLKERKLKRAQGQENTDLRLEFADRTGKQDAVIEGLNTDVSNAKSSKNQMWWLVIAGLLIGYGIGVLVAEII